VIALSVGHHPTSTEPYVTAADAPITPATMNATSTSGQGSSLPQADLATQEGRTNKEKTDGLSAAPADSHVGNHTCQAGTSGSNQACMAIKPRRVGVRAVTDSPAMARIVLGRTPSPPAAMSPQEQTAAMGPPDMPAASSGDAETTPSAAQTDPENRSRSAAPSKKVKNTARRDREKRRRNEWENNLPWIERADNSTGRTLPAAGAFGRAYAREASYGRRGFWEWSW
jgi:hypothetical protein